MSDINEDIDQLLADGISIIEAEVNAIKAKQPLAKPDSDKLIEYIKVLVLVRRDWRVAEGEHSAKLKKLYDTDEKLDAAIQAELAKQDNNV